MWAHFDAASIEPVPAAAACEDRTTTSCNGVESAAGRLTTNHGANGEPNLRELEPNRRLVLLLPVLRLIGRRALSTDLDFLRRSLEEGLDLTRLATRES